MRQKHWFALQLDPIVFPRRRLRLLALLLSATLVFGLFYLGSKPFSGGLFSPPWDKLVHFLFFGGLTGMFWVLLGGRSATADFGALFLSASVGAADEWAQAFNPARYASTIDFFFDVGGALLAVSILAFARYCLKAGAESPISVEPRSQTF